MPTRRILAVGLVAVVSFLGGALLVSSQEGKSEKGAKPPPHDAIADFQTPREVPATRPEQKKTAHDRSNVFDPQHARPVSPALDHQPEKGRFEGFDFGRDPLGAKYPMQTAESIMKEDVKNKPTVMETQRKLLARRYDLKANLDLEAKMSRGKPLPVGPTARLPENMTWEQLADMSPDDIRKQGLFPYPALPHPKQTPGGFVFPSMVLQMFPRLERFDVDFDLPEEFLPEFPPAIFLSNRPELGDVSRGEVVSINNFYALFKGMLTPVQLDGLRLLLTPLPQEEFNVTDDRKSPRPTLGVACLDCHVNGHTNGAIELNPDDRPEQRRLRLDTPSLRGVSQQQIHGSKRSIRSVRDFSEFEQRSAYFNGDQSHLEKKGILFISPDQAMRMERVQMMFDFPPAPKLNGVGRLDRKKATESELRGEKLFFGKAQCAVCHPAPFYLDNQMHDLHLERFLNEPGDGPMKSFTLRGIKDSPPYMHDGRCLTLEDTVEFFNLVLELKLTKEEKKDLVAFLRQL